jgi:hypothetical protein
VVKLYVEGGGDSAVLRTACREGFTRFITRAGIAKRPRTAQRSNYPMAALAALESTGGRRLGQTCKRLGHRLPPDGAGHGKLVPGRSRDAQDIFRPRFSGKRLACRQLPLLKGLEHDIGWMYETTYTDGKTKGRIEYTVQYDGKGEVPSQIHSYLSTNHKDLRGLEKNSPALVAKAKDRWYVPDPNKAQDLEKKREKALLKEFDAYRSFTGRKIKESRLEVLRAGFRAAWASKDYATIIGIANKLPDETLQEDEKLLTLYDLALTRTEDAS